VKYDITPAQVDDLIKGMDFLEERTKYYLDVVTTDETFLQRTKGIGTMNTAQAEELGALGPTARASGVARDVRIDSPYASYADFPANLITETDGDLQARYVVRIRELVESYRIVREVLSKLPVGELTARVPRKIKEGETISRIEAPRGELFYFLKSNGGEQPERVKIRTPSISNFTTVVIGAPGHQLADIPMILAGIDPCFSCNDRSIVVHQRGTEIDTMPWETIRQMGIRRYGKKTS
jgi:ech hydrogenase subunit E